MSRLFTKCTTRVEAAVNLVTFPYWLEMLVGVPHVLAFAALNVWLVRGEPKSRKGWWLLIGAYVYLVLFIFAAVNPASWPYWLQMLVAVPSSFAIVAFGVWAWCSEPKSRNGWRLFIACCLYIAVFLLLIARRMPIYHR